MDPVVENDIESFTKHVYSQNKIIIFKYEEVDKLFQELCHFSLTGYGFSHPKNRTNRFPHSTP